MQEKTEGQQKKEIEDGSDGLAMEGVEVGIAAPSDQDLIVEKPADGEDGLAMEGVEVGIAAPSDQDL